MLFKGLDLSFMWFLPFAGLLCSIACMPVFLPRFWEQHFGKTVFFWSVLTLGLLAVFQGISQACFDFLSVFLHEYLPFALLIGVLYLIASHIVIQVYRSPTPWVNSVFLWVGSIMAGFIGTTGASMILIRPLIALNQRRHHKVHIFIFFIFLVSNIGGVLSTLGDPPLFVGFLHKVPFFWPTQHLFVPFLLIQVPLLVIFFLTDLFFYKKEKRSVVNKTMDEQDMPSLSKILSPQKSYPLGIQGGSYFFVFLGVIILMVLSAHYPSEQALVIYNVVWPWTHIAREGLLLGLFILLKQKGNLHYRLLNHFSWHPLIEVFVLFLGIFITAIPVFAILSAGKNGSCAGLIALLEKAPFFTQAWRTFWSVGILSSFLDNAPTYLVFLYLCGGNPLVLIQSQPNILLALSLGAVFMGALTYVGNAPNMMVKSIAQTESIPMPSFFGYMGIACLVLLPLFLLLSWFLFL
jgi:Na+/H+ antiporter NhaD/arsenite permease-like protein